MKLSTLAFIVAIIAAGAIIFGGIQGGRNPEDAIGLLFFAAMLLGCFVWLSRKG